MIGNLGRASAGSVGLLEMRGDEMTPSSGTCSVFVARVVESVPWAVGE